MTDRFQVGPAIGNAWPLNDFAPVGEELDVIAGDQISVGPSGFSDLPFKFCCKPQIVVVKKSDPLTVRAFDPYIARGADVAVVEFDIHALMSGRDFPTGPAHIVGFPIRYADDFVVRKCLRPHAGDSLSKHLGAVMCWNDDRDKRHLRIPPLNPRSKSIQPCPTS